MANSKGSITQKKNRGQNEKNGARSNEERNASLKTNQTSWLLSQQSVISVSILSLILFHRNNFFNFQSSAPSTHTNPMSQCGLIMANSSLPDSGWGMFPLRPIPAGHPVSFGDPCLQVPDISRDQAHYIAHLLHNYMWAGEVTGGIHEGRVVYSILPGVGSLANGHPVEWNMVMGPTERDSAGLHRSESPGAGAFTYYHNFSFYSHRFIAPGQELMVNYGNGWKNKIPHDHLGEQTKKPVEWLRSNGICLDHIKPALSDVPHAGRGAVATHFLPKGTIVAPVPLLPIQSRDVLKRKDGTWQLLLNYCFSHSQSNYLFVPYSPVVNLVNHASKNQANVKIQWSRSNLFARKHLLEMKNIFESNPTGLLMELVAIRDIEHGEEILLFYGDAWQLAWERHVDSYVSSSHDYVYANEANRVINILRTPTELVVNPYPQNVRTMCFYEFHSTHQESPVKWKSTALQFRNQYPCTILERHGDNVYDVLIKNSDSALNRNKIPDKHIVTNVPRHAIRLDDKLRSSDQNMANTFRHEIHIPDDMFPDIWKDLA